MNTEVQRTSGTTLHLLFTADVWNGLVKKRFGLKLSKYELEFPLRYVGTLIRKTKKKKANKKR